MNLSAKDVWESVLGELQLQINANNFNTWLKPTRGISCDNNIFTIGVPNSFVGEWLEKRWMSLIKKTLVSMIGYHIDVKIQVGFDSTGSPEKVRISSEKPVEPVETASPPLLSRYTFDNFIVCDTNRLAHAAAVGVANGPGKSYNPLFLYSGSGLGKTHLLQAIGHAAWTAGHSVLYSNGEQFTNEFVNSIRNRTIEDFRSKYRSPDILLMDDVQFISGKEQTQESFFYTFNDLYNSSRQMVISCDQPPNRLPLLVDRLRSRFEWGIIVDISPPDYESRLAILREKSEKQNLNLTAETLDTIARSPISNVRILEGCLNKLAAHTRLYNEAPSHDVVMKAIEDTCGANPGKRLSPDRVLEIVSNHYGCSKQVILRNDKRDRQTTFLKHIVIYLIRENCSISFANIGEFLGYKDRTSVLYGYGKVAKALKNDEALKQSLDKINQDLHK
ncbi:MAG: chromosomal replication initiator protein DnaA [Dehalococcoidia bacterium]|nr:chromosomal replication initiator protein DnaA [Dehalococcoidia bacterium]MDZ4245592.1 chromosomal replication initiator protein DnaA [Dehalococcoidia bacterium]